MNFSTENKISILKITYLILVIFGVIAFFSHFILVSGIFFWLSCVISLYHEKDLILKFVKSRLVVNFYNLFILFISGIIALKGLSFILDIEEDKFKFAPIILSVPISIFIAWFIVLSACLISFVIIPATLIFKIISDRAYDWVSNTKFIRLIRNSVYIMVFITPFIFIIALAFPILVKIAILSDASFISDCGEKNLETVYLRINTKECYEYSPWFYLNEPIKIESNAKIN
ncbi:hypothetical protein CHI95_09510 [Providencia rettgeri]|uniref:Uncharacterized protein n=1 Tax=Providencia rettgeri TaxID=587 RepID=A0A264VU22_PRORE|nr:hypothetical protein [Providencia rettgeri]OZS74811.1 hypothetical protein CHI95_09510 [Providencia rettgeri]